MYNKYIFTYGLIDWRINTNVKNILARSMPHLYIHTLIKRELEPVYGSSVRRSNTAAEWLPGIDTCI